MAYGNVPKWNNSWNWINLKSFVWIVWILSLTSQFSIILVDSAELPTSDVQEALQIAIDYFNASTNLADRIEVVEKYYELERDEGIFMPARKRQPPKEMQKILDELDDIEFYFKDWDGIDLDEKVQDEFVKRLKATQILLEDNFGPFSKHFRIRSNDPMALYMKAVKKTQENFDSLQEEFEDYTKIQFKAKDAYQKVQSFGIQLTPVGDDSFALFVTKEKYEDMLKETKQAHENIPQGGIDFLKSLVPEYKPTEYTDEILALQDVQNGRSIDETTKKMLMDFTPKCNKKAFYIIDKLLNLQKLVESITEESQGYGNYYIEKRTELYELLFKLKKRFGYSPDDWTNDSNNFGTDKDEL